MDETSVRKREELAWVAGFFDGEGNTCFVKGKDFNLLMVQIAQIDRRVLDRVKAATGIGNVYGPYHKGGDRNDIWQWNTGKFEHAQAFIAMIWEWLSPVKREQAAEALRSALACKRQPRKLRSGSQFDAKTINYIRTSSKRNVVIAKEFCIDPNRIYAIRKGITYRNVGIDEQL